MYIEANADARAVAQQTYQMFVAFRNEGFTAEQAFEMVKVMVREMMRNV